MDKNTNKNTQIDKENRHQLLKLAAKYVNPSDLHSLSNDGLYQLILKADPTLSK